MAIPQQVLNEQEQVQRVVLAGMKFMYDKNTFPMLMRGISKQAPVSTRLAMETGGVMKMIDDRTAKGIPPNVVSKAAILIMLDMAQFMAQANMAKPTQDDIKQAMGMLQQILIEVFSKHGKAVTRHGPRSQPAPQVPPGMQPTQSPQPSQTPPQGLIAGAQGA